MLERVVLGLILASAMMLGGCVAQADDEDAILDDSQAAIEAEDGEEGTRDQVVVVPSRGDGMVEVRSVVGGDDCSSDPQPNPWLPTATAKGPPGGPSDPGPSQRSR